MGQFRGKIDLEVIPGKANLWLVVNDFLYLSDAGDSIKIRAGLITDLASTPRIVWNLYPPFGLYTGPAILHDYLYKNQFFARERCDALFLEAMKADCVPYISRQIIYRAVRAFGWAAWNKHGKELAAAKLAAKAVLNVQPQ